MRTMTMDFGGNIHGLRPEGPPAKAEGSANYRILLLVAPIASYSFDRQW